MLRAPIHACACRCASATAGAAATLNAVFTSARWVNACGKLPSMRFATGSYSSESRPTSFASATAARTARAPRRAARAARSSRRARTSTAGRRLRRAAGRRRRLRACDSGARSRRRRGSRSIASTVPRTRGSRRGEEADERDQQQARVELFRAVRLRERAELGVEALARRPRAWIVVADRAPALDRAVEPPASRPSARRGRTRPRPSPSSATKCRRSPRISQMPSSGSCQIVSSTRAATSASAHALCSTRARARAPGTARPSPRRRRRSAAARSRRCRCAPGAEPS